MSQVIAPKSRSVNQTMWLTLLRVALGLILAWKGIDFIRDTAALKSTIEQTGIGVFSHNSGSLALAVTILTLLCGFLITVGLFTRIASIIQLPILIVALFFVTLKNMERYPFEMILTVIVLLLLILFAIKGSGPLSADEYFRRGALGNKNANRVFE